MGFGSLRWLGRFPFESVKPDFAERANAETTDERNTSAMNALWQFQPSSSVERPHPEVVVMGPASSLAPIDI